MIRNWLCLLPCLLFLLHSPVKAQDTITKKPIFLHGAFYFDYKKSYGITAGIDFPIASYVSKRVSGKNHLKVRTRDWIVSSDLGVYFNNLSNGILLSGSIGQRFSWSGPYYFEWLTGIGGLRTFYDGIVYKVDDNNNVKERGFFGRYYGSFHVATNFGWDFSIKNKSLPITIQLKPLLWFQFPYNSFALPHLSTELGIKYHPVHWNRITRKIEHR